MCNKLKRHGLYSLGLTIIVVNTDWDQDYSKTRASSLSRIQHGNHSSMIDYFVFVFIIVGIFSILRYTNGFSVIPQFQVLMLTLHGSKIFEEFKIMMNWLFTEIRSIPTCWNWKFNGRSTDAAGLQTKMQNVMTLAWLLTCDILLQGLMQCEDKRFSQFLSSLSIAGSIFWSAQHCCHTSFTINYSDQPLCCSRKQSFFDARQNMGENLSKHLTNNEWYVLFC